MSGNRITGVLLLLSGLFLGGCYSYCNEQPCSWYGKQTAVQASEQGIDYSYTICLANNGNRDALRMLMRMDDFDAAGAKGHAAVLICMVQKYGQCAFIRELKKENELDREYVTTLIRQEIARRDNCPDQARKNEYAKFQSRYPYLYAYSMRRAGQYTSGGVVGAEHCHSSPSCRKP